MPKKKKVSCLTETDYFLFGKVSLEKGVLTIYTQRQRSIPKCYVTCWPPSSNNSCR